MKMRTILLATVAGVLLTGNAVARDKCPMSNSNCRLAKSDILESHRRAAEDELRTLRQQIGKERADARVQQEQQRLEQNNQLQLDLEQSKRQLREAGAKLDQMRTKADSLAAQQGQRAPAVTPLVIKINLNPGSAEVWHAPRPFKSVVPGNIEVAAILPGPTDADLVITGKVEGLTNFVLLDGEGIIVANIIVQVGTPLPIDQVRIENKKLEPMKINLNPGFAEVWHAPRPFKSVVPGNIEVADVIAGPTDADLVITGKVEGLTNVVLLDGEGIIVATLLVQVGTPLPIDQVRVHNKNNNISAYTSYQCSPYCYRKEDKMEGNDRVPAPNTVINLTVPTPVAPAR